MDRGGGGENPSTSVVVDGSRAVTAVFAQVELTVDKEGEGTVSVSPPGGAQTLPFTGTYGFGDAVTLTAGEATGWQFDHWEGDVPSGDANANPLSLELDGDKDVTAVFHVKLQVHDVDHATINSPFNLLDWLFPGSGVQLSAAPDQGYEVAFWKITVQPDGGGQGSGLMQMTMGMGGFVQYLMGANVSYTVYLPTDAEPVVRPDGKYYLLVESEWVDGQSVGHVTVNANAAPVEGPTDLGQGRTLYLFNQYTDFVSNPPIPVVVTLEGVPDEAGWAFDAWEGDIASQPPDGNPITLTMNQDRVVKATFTDTVYLTVDVEGEGTVSVDPDQTGYAIGDVVSLAASGVGGWMIHHWIDTDGNPTEYFKSEISVTMNQDQHITAVFYLQKRLRMNVAGPGMVSVAGKTPSDGQFFEYFDIIGDADPPSVNLRAYADDGAVFKEWQGDEVIPNATSNPASIVMDADKEVTAKFEAVDVRFEEHQSQKYGFDDFTNDKHPWKSVALNDDDVARALIALQDPTQIYFTGEQTSIASIAPGQASSATTTVTVTGHSIGAAEIRAREGSSTGSEVGEMGVAVYQPIANVNVIVRYVYLQTPDDLQEIPFGQSGTGPTDICVSPGPDGVLDTAPQGDDVINIDTGTISVGPDLVCDTMATNFSENPAGPTFPKLGFENYLNDVVYNQSVASFVVDVAPPAIVAYNTINISEYALDYETIESSIIRDNASTAETAYHIFLVSKIKPDRVVGFAALNSLWIYASSRADFSDLAHELGHAFGNLVDLESSDGTGGLTDPENLMSYHYYEGYADYLLRKHQWDDIHTARDQNPYPVPSP